MLKCPTYKEQQKYVAEADLVIWACGYQTNYIPIKDACKELSLSRKVPFTQFDVDSKCRIITSDNELLVKAFGSGLAFPQRSNDGMVLQEQGKVNPRADSFSLYLNYVANQMLSSLLPKLKLETKLVKALREGGSKVDHQ